MSGTGFTEQVKDRHPVMTRLFISVGESSGDNQATLLLHELKAIIPNLEMRGIGGKGTQAEGVEILEGLERLEVMGFVEVFAHLSFFMSLKKRLLKEIAAWKPDIVVLVDYPGFNSSLARGIKQVSPDTKVVYYISPQYWAWRPGRVKKLLPHIDLMLVFFPFEEDFYHSYGFEKARFIGYPSLDVLKPKMDREEFFKSLKLNPQKPLLGLLPGSRRQEIDKLLPEFIDIAIRIKDRIKDLQGIIALAPSINIEEIRGLPDFIVCVKGMSCEVMKYSSFVLVASGTASLETSLFQTPNAVFYRMNIFSYLLARHMIRVKYIAMSNLLVGRMIVKEYPQFWDNEKVASEITDLLMDTDRLSAFKESLQEVRDKLGNPGAARRGAEEIISLLQES
jgi:lipid-A-disaccharide synthase